MLNKMDEFRYTAVPKTWVTAEITDRELNIEGYMMNRNNRLQDI